MGSTNMGVDILQQATVGLKNSVLLKNKRSGMYLWQPGRRPGFCSRSHIQQFLFGSEKMVLHCFDEEVLASGAVLDQRFIFHSLDEIILRKKRKTDVLHQR